MVYPTKEEYITCGFGRPGSWAAGYHTGIDFKASEGTRIYATRGGTVIHAGWGGYGISYGSHIIIRTTYKGRTIHALYAHLSDPHVRVGQKVEVDQWIANSGNTGNTTGPHLHYEERTYPFGYYNHIRPVLLYYRPSTKVSISLSNLKKGKKSLAALRVKRRLNKKFPGRPRLPLNRMFGDDMQQRYREWQKRLGYDGHDANGIPGKLSLEKLGFKVRP